VTKGLRRPSTKKKEPTTSRKWRSNRDRKYFTTNKEQIGNHLDTLREKGEGGEGVFDAAGKKKSFVRGKKAPDGEEGVGQETKRGEQKQVSWNEWRGGYQMRRRKKKGCSSCLEGNQSICFWRGVKKKKRVQKG